MQSIVIPDVTRRQLMSTFPIPALAVQVGMPCGFLGLEDPVAELATHEATLFAPWSTLAAHAPELLEEGSFHAQADALPVFAGTLQNIPDPMLWRVFVSVGFLVQSYIWGDLGFPKKPRTHLPAGIAVLAHKLGVHFGVRPLLVYATYALKNWRRIYRSGPIIAENVTMLEHFNPKSQPERLIAEDWFVAIHVEIEHEASRLLHAMQEAEDARLRADAVELVLWLTDMTHSLERMRSILSRMSERCGPDIYYQFVRSYLSGCTKLLTPEGIIYEGVKHYGGVPQYFDGQTGAQSSIMPALDRFLCIPHHSRDLSSHLGRMLHYHTPRKHRAYVLAWSKRVRFANKATLWRVLEGDASVQEALRQMRLAAALFRREHYILAITHIARPAHRMLGETNPIGTGGSKLISSLLLHLEETVHPSERTERMSEFRTHFQELLGRPV